MSQIECVDLSIPISLNVELAKHNTGYMSTKLATVQRTNIEVYCAAIGKGMFRHAKVGQMEKQFGNFD